MRFKEFLAEDAAFDRIEDELYSIMQDHGYETDDEGNDPDFPIHVDVFNSNWGVGDHTMIDVTWNEHEGLGALFDKDNPDYEALNAKLEAKIRKKKEKDRQRGVEVILKFLKKIDQIRNIVDVADFHISAQRHSMNPINNANFENVNAGKIPSIPFRIVFLPQVLDDDEEYEDEE